MGRGFGVPAYGGNFGKKNFFSLKWGDQTFRVLPPFGSLRYDGKWYEYYRVHWGAKVLVDGKEQRRNFLCIERIDFRTKEVLERCPACEQIREREEEYDRKSNELIQQGMSRDQVRDALEPLSEWLKTYNVSGRYYLNVMDTSGKVGRLDIPGQMKSHLEKAIEFVRSKGYDPLSLDAGFWFVFSRTRGEKGGPPIFAVSPMGTEVRMGEGEVGTVWRPSALSQEQIQAALDGCFDLREEPPAARLTFEQIDSIVRSNYDAEVVAAVMNAAREERSRSRNRYSNGAPKGPSRPAPVEDFSAFRNEEPAPVEATPSAPEPVDEAEALRAQIAALEAKLQKQAASRATTPEPAQAPPAPPVAAEAAPDALHAQGGDAGFAPSPATRSVTPPGMSVDDLMNASVEDFLKIMDASK